MTKSTNTKSEKLWINFWKYPAFVNMFEYLQNVTKPLNESKLFAGIMIIVLNLATKHVNWNLPKPIESYLKFTFSRNILIFAICWMGSRDILIAFFLTLVFIVVMDYILNDSSSYCCLPESFVNYHNQKLDEAQTRTINSDPRISPPAINSSQDKNEQPIIAETNLRTGDFSSSSQLATPAPIQTIQKIKMDNSVPPLA